MRQLLYRVRDTLDHRLDWAPLVWVLVALSVKLIYFSAAQRDEWSNTSLATWAREHPHLFSTTAGTLLLMLSPFPLLPRALRLPALILLNVAITTLVLANLLHAAWYGDVLSVWSVGPMANVHAVKRSVIALLHPGHALLFLDLVLAVVLLPLWWRAAPRERRLLGRQHRVRVSAALAGLGLLLVMPAASLISEDDNGEYGFVSLQRDVCERIGLLPYHVWDAAEYLKRPRTHVTEADRARVRRFFEERRARPTEPSPLFGVARKRNVILISAESLQSFPLGLRVGKHAVTPHLNAFADESLKFVNFYDQTHLGTTADGEFTTLQSLHPPAAGVVVNLYSENRFRALPAIAAEHGYDTLSAVAEPPDFWLMNVMHPKYGFRHSFFDDTFTLTERLHGWGADHQFFPQAVDLLATRPEPFLAYLLSSSNHHPWKLPRHHQHLPLGDLEGSALGDYLQSVHYFDRAFGNFVDRLQAVGLLDRSMVVVYGDHQGFGRQPELRFGRHPELLAKRIGLSPGNRFHLMRVRKRVPLLIRLPRGEAARQYDAVGGHLDTAPTILALLGIRDRSSVMLGRDLTAEQRSLVVFRDGSFVDDEHYLANRLGTIDRCACYEVATSRPRDCEPLREQRLRARDRLEISDLVLAGDVIPSLAARAVPTD